MENIVTKGEIARSVQFLLLSLCFQKTSAANASASGKGLILKKKKKLEDKRDISYS